MGILVKLIVLAYCMYIVGCFATGATMQAPYHTLENTRENALWRAIEVIAALIGAIAVTYWLVLDLHQ